MKILIFLSLLFCVYLSKRAVQGADKSAWGYKTGKSFKSPDQWKHIPGSSCGGRRQSPIDIRTKRLQFYSVLRPVTFPNNTNNSRTAKVKKDDLTLKLNFNDKWKITFGTYGCLRPFSIHLHWGSKDTRGSEHTIDGKEFPLESHLVAYNCDIYNSSDVAMISPSGLYVFGMLYKLGSPSKTIDKILSALNSSSSSQVVTNIEPRDFLPKNLNNYYRYEGSLTTPPCTENVIWTVMEEKISIDKFQLEQLRSLRFGPPESGFMEDNYRPVMSFGDSTLFIKRLVYVSFNHGSAPIHNLFTLMICLLLVVLI